MNKRGILLPETLKIILAVIGIGFLILLMVSLYGIFNQKTELEQARALLDKVENTIDYMVENNLESNSDILLVNPNKWFIIQKGNEICVCPEVDGDDCETEGVCKEIDHDFKIFEFDRAHVNYDPIFRIVIDTKYGVKALRIEKSEGVYGLSTVNIDFFGEMFSEFLEGKMKEINLITGDVGSKYRYLYDEDKTLMDLFEVYCRDERPNELKLFIERDQLEAFMDGIFKDKRDENVQWIIYVGCEENGKIDYKHLRTYKNIIDKPFGGLSNSIVIVFEGEEGEEVYFNVVITQKKV